MVGCQPVLRQNHPTTCLSGKVHGSGSVHPGASKGKGPSVNPQDGAFNVLFPRHLSPSPILEFEGSKFSTPWPGIQARCHFNGLSDLLRCGLGDISTKDPGCVVGTFKPRGF